MHHVGIKRGALLKIIRSTGVFLLTFVFLNLVLYLPQSWQDNKVASILNIKEALAAITFQGTGALNYSAAGGTSVTPVIPATSAGDLLVLIIGMKPSVANSGSVTTPVGWTPITSLTGAGGYGAVLGADTGNTNVFSYYQVSAGGASGSLPVTIATNNVSWAQIYWLSAGAGSTWNVAGTTGSDITGNAAVSIAHSSNPAVAAGDYILGAMVIPTDVTTPAQFSAEALSQTGITFGTVTEIVEPDTTNGNDIGGVVYRAPVSSGTATAAPTFTATAGGTVTNVRGPGVFIKIREIPPPDATLYANSTESGLNFINCATTGCGARITTGADQTVSIIGTNFGTVAVGSRANCAGAANTGCVRIANYTIPDANVITWIDTSIQFRIPSGVTVFGGAGTTCGGAGANGLCVTAASKNDLGGALEFWVFPDITAISPSGAGEGREGALVTITGNRFDSVSGTVVFQNCAGADQTATVGTWTDTSISVTVPTGIADNDDLCDVKVTRAAGTGSKTDTSTNFIVLPDIIGMGTCSAGGGRDSACGINQSPEYSAGDTLGLIMLNGNHFGASAGTVTFTGGVVFSVHAAVEGACTVGGWTSTSVCVEVNSTIPDTTNNGAITLDRGAVGGTDTDIITLELLPRIISVSPASEIVGNVVTIDGNHFCNTIGCPGAPPTADYKIFFGSTEAIATDFVATGNCTAQGVAWSNTRICAKVPSGTPIGIQNIKVMKKASPNQESERKSFTVPSTIPNDPSSLQQYKSDGTTVISVGSGTNETSVVFKASMSGLNPSTLCLQIEHALLGIPFTNTETAQEGDPGQQACKSYTGTLVTGVVTISGLSDGVSYHWQARVKRSSGELSNWISFGGNPDPGGVDFIIDISGPNIFGPCVVNSSASSCDSSLPTGTQAQIRWSTTESSDEQVAYGTSCPTGQASAAATFAVLTNKQPSNPSGSATTHAQILSGLSGGTVYYYMLRSADTLGNVSYQPATANTCSQFTQSFAGYAPTGTVTSPTFDTSTINGATFNSIGWKGLKPPNTHVRLQFATSNNGVAGPFNFIGGSTCTAADYYEPNPDNEADLKCFSSFNNRRYFQYKVILCSSNDCSTLGPQTPQVNDVMVNWSP